MDVLEWSDDDNIVIETTSDEVFRQALFARNLYPRNDSSGCAVCESGVTLKCDDSCYNTPGYECVQVVSVSNCRECPGTKCRQTSTTSSSSSSSLSTTGAAGTAASGGSSNGPNAGIIAGATIGGVILLSMTAFLIWFFFIKKKRAEERISTYNPVAEKTIPDDTALRNNRSSMHTVHSIASTVLTRASNIIQIAYIPGVTNRAGPTSPTVLVPPVPPIPIQVTQANGQTSSDQHFFMPGDLRASTYSDMSGFSDRTSYAQPYATRASVASTIYGKNAVIVSAPQTGMRAKPYMVSVRNGGAVPPMPGLDTIDRFTERPKSRAESTFSVGSAYVNQAAATAISVKGPAIRVISAKKSGSLASTNEDGESASGASSGTIIMNVKPELSPFADPELESNEGSSKAGRMSAVMEEESVLPKIVSTITEEEQKEQGGVKTEQKKRDSSPFSDVHATKE